MAAGIFEVTLYPTLADLKGVAPDPSKIECPVSAEYRRSGDLNVQRESGTFECNRIELNQAGDADVSGYGRLLGRGLFRGQIERLFHTALGENDPLHVLLSLEAPSLRGLSWERLCGPVGVPLGDGWDFLGMSQRTPFAVYVAGGTTRSFPPLGFSALQVLLVVASPTGAGDALSFDADKIRNAILSGLDGVRPTVLARGSGTAGPPTLPAILNQLTCGNHTVLHLVCHGTYEWSASDFLLYLEDDRGSAHRVSGNLFLENLQRLGSGRKLPYLTFLSACRSAGPGLDSHDRFAQVLVRSLGLPAAVGMAAPVTPDTAGAVARVFYRQLREHGHPDLALAEARAERFAQRDILIPVLISQLGAQPLFDPTIDDPPRTAEGLEKGLGRLEEELKRRGPVLLDDFRNQAERARDAFRNQAGRARADQPDSPLWKEVITELNNIADEAVGVSFNALALDRAAPPYKGDTCPFNGMKPFDFSRRDFFKARQGLVAELKSRLEAEGVLAVIGPSGVGKTSLVFAGLIPALGLNEGGFTDFTPGPDPVATLEAALGRGQAATLLVIDQLEDLFTQQSATAGQQQFIECLLAQRDKRRIIFTMRSEFREHCRNLPLWQFVSDPSSDIKSMRADELRVAMEEQAAQVGLRFETNLVPMILGDLEEEPGRMPLLQHALLELWQNRHGVWLKADEYLMLGGIQEAVSRTADGFYRNLPDDAQRRRVKNIFLRLVRAADEKDTPDETRRRARIEDLIPAGEVQRLTLQFVQDLEDRYLVVVDGQIVEVAHEALIRHWPSMRLWVSAYRSDLLRRQEVGAAARAWVENERRPDHLVHRGERLIELGLLTKHKELTLNETETDYLAACQQLREQEQTEKEEQTARELAAAKALAETERRLKEEAQRRREQAEALAEIERRLKEEALRNEQYERRLKEEALQNQQQAEALARESLRNQQQAEALAETERRLKEEAQRRQEQAEALANTARRLKEEEVQNRERAEKLAQSEAKRARQFRWAMLISLMLLGLVILFYVLQKIAAGEREAALHEKATALEEKAEALSREQIALKLAKARAEEKAEAEARAAEEIRNAQYSLVLSNSARQIDLKDSQRALKYLYDTAFEPRGWEWYYLRNKAEPRWTSFRGHSDPVVSVAFSPDHKLLASADREGRVCIFDPTSQSPIRIARFTEHKAPVTALAFHPSEELIASADAPEGGAGTIYIWRPRTAQLVHTLKGHKGSINAMAFLPDGQLMSGGGPEGGPAERIVWDVKAGKEVGQYPPGQHRLPIRSLALSTDGSIVVHADAEKTVVERRREGKATTLNMGGLVALSPDGRLLILPAKESDGVFSLLVYDLHFLREPNKRQ